MIKVNCDAEQKRSLTQMTQFQGELKKRTDKDIDGLCASLLTDGLVAPFIIWAAPDKEYLLDGHGRQQALIKLAMRDPSILTQTFPVVIVEAESEQEAAKQLLLINNNYGKMTKKGIADFVSARNITAPVYKLPVFNKPSIPVVNKSEPTFIIVKLKINKDVAPAIVNMLADTKGVEVL